MFRRLCLLTAALIAFSGAFFATSAGAQGEPTCPGVLSTRPVVVDPPTPATSETPVGEGDTATDSDTSSPASLNAEPAVTTTGCADAIAYPGPFSNMPVVPASPYAIPRGISAPAPAPATTSTTTAPAAGSGLAHSGSEAFVLAYLGTGLVAFGLVALGLRRGNLGE